MAHPRRDAFAFVTHAIAAATAAVNAANAAVHGGVVLCCVFLMRCDHFLLRYAADVALSRRSIQFNSFQIQFQTKDARHRCITTNTS
mmetsp:Transcript_32612/g.36486  ORF Transcript_32612/g.36486 Transcript_32612/m.36486 type:complete len:87 (-) Transcript_32612:78-338(-)